MSESTRKLESLYGLYCTDKHERWLQSLKEKPNHDPSDEEMSAMPFPQWIEWWNSSGEAQDTYFKYWIDSKVTAALNRRSTARLKSGEWYHGSYAWIERYYDEIHQRDIEILADEYCRRFAKRSYVDNSVTLANSAAFGVN